MRILMVSHFYAEHGGGIERVAKHLCRELVDQGAELCWAASAESANGNAGSQDDVIRLPLNCLNPTEALTGLPMPIPTLPALRHLHRSLTACDAVIIHDALYITSISAMLLAKWQGKQVILIQHIAAIPFANPLLRLLMVLANFLVTQPMLWAADELVFISDIVRRDLLGAQPRRSYHLLFNGVDQTIFHPPLDIRKNAGQPRLLFVGRYVEKKGLRIIQALAKLRPDWHISLVGSGPIDAAGWGLDNVQDLGPQTPERLAALYQSHDLLLLPSVGEGYPLVIQEAMACGLPVICGADSAEADPAATQWLNGVDIKLKEPDASASRCAQAIAGLQMNSKQRLAMAQYAAQSYSWRAMASSLIQLIQRNS